MRMVVVVSMVVVVAVLLIVDNKMRKWISLDFNLLGSLSPSHETLVIEVWKIARSFFSRHFFFLRIILLRHTPSVTTWSHTHKQVYDIGCTMIESADSALLTSFW